MRVLGLVCALAALAPCAVADAGTFRRGDATLTTTTTERGTCMGFRHPGGSAGDCQDTAITLSTPFVTTLGPGVAALVAPEVATVEVRSRGGAVRRMGTVPDGPLRLAWDPSLVSEGSAWFVRLLAADGTVIGARQHREAPALHPSAPLVSWPTEDHTTRMAAHVRLDHVPLPGAVDRLIPQPCLLLRARTAGARQRHDFDQGERCVPAEPEARPLVAPLDDIDRVKYRGDFLEVGQFRLAGLTRPEVRTLRVTLGSGRAVTVPTRPFPARLGVAARWYHWAVPPREAVGTIAVLGADGRPLATIAAHEGPAVLPTPSPVLEPVAVGPPLPDGPAETLAPDLGARRVGSLVCVRLAGLAWNERCSTPPVLPSQQILTEHADAHGLAYGGIVAPEVARVVALTYRGSAAAETVPVPGGAERAFAFRTAKPMSGLDLLDAQGRIIARRGLGNDGGPARLDPPADRPILRTTVRGAGPLTLLRGPRGTSCFAIAETSRCGERVTVLVPCRPRATIVAVRLDASQLRRLRVITHDGRALARRDVAGERLAVFAAPPGAKVDRVTFVNARGRAGRIRLGPLPSPRRQCGYGIGRSPGDRSTSTYG